MLDLNDVAPALHYDLDALSAALARHAEDWAPRYFPNGRKADGTIRLANIEGEAPRKQGSTVIQLAGANAGAWFDHTLGAGGGPLSTLQHATGLEGRPLLELAASLCNYTPESKEPDRRGPRSGSLPAHADVGGTSTQLDVLQGADDSKPKSSETENNTAHVDRAATKDARALAEIAHILAHSAETAPDSTMGAYLRSRGLSLPDCPDLLYCPNCTDYKTGTGRPAMIAVIRNAAGDRIGLHRTYLAYDGTGKAPDMENPRKMLGASRGGAVRLAAPTDTLGIAEGIETALSATALFHVPCWAALSAKNLADFTPPEGVRLVVFADAGEAGLGAAAKLQARYVNSEIAAPRSTDDWNADLQQGLWKPGERWASVDLKVNSTNSAFVHPTRGDTSVSAPEVAGTPQQPTVPITVFPNQVWTRGITWITNPAGIPKPLISNVCMALEHAPEWTGVIGHDDFGRRLMVKKPTPWQRQSKNGHGPPANGFHPRPWTDHDDTEATRWVQWFGIHAPTHVVQEAIGCVAIHYHPVRDYLSAAVWDGQPRLDNWLVYYFGAAPAPYISAISAAFLISAIARVMVPGAKVDHLPILEGPQGIGKSTGLRIQFGDEWFADSISELGSKDAALELSGKWCIEFAELHTFRRTDKNALKAFLSRISDHFRPPYGRHAVDVPRQCVFAGTSNEEVYLEDHTGGRRYWPAKCTSIDLEAIARDRDQLWAEAYHRYQNGEKYYLTDEAVLPAAEAEQEARQQDDALAEPVTRWLREQIVNDVSIGEVLGGLGFPKDRWDRGHQIRVGHVLRGLGWQRYRAAAHGDKKQAWRYKRQTQG